MLDHRSSSLTPDLSRGPLSIAAGRDLPRRLVIHAGNEIEEMTDVMEAVAVVAERLQQGHQYLCAQLGVALGDVEAFRRDAIGRGLARGAVGLLDQALAQ